MRLGSADLVCLDEPTASLSPEAVRQVYRSLLSTDETRARKRTTIFITHRLEEARLADRVRDYGSYTWIPLTFAF
jgi:ABC-type sugar transport system ATPase subunit